MSPYCKIWLVLAILLTAPVAAFAQTDNQAAQGGQPQPAPQTASPATPQAAPSVVPTAAVADQLLKPEQLEALVAPIALYPDDLLANVLAASTYPLEIIQADRWAKAHKDLKGDALKNEVEKQPWDESVKALASVSEVLSMMSEKIDWTKDLGDAVLAHNPAASSEGSGEQQAGDHATAKSQRADAGQQTGCRHPVRST